MENEATKNAIHSTLSLQQHKCLKLKISLMAEIPFFTHLIEMLSCVIDLMHYVSCDVSQFKYM